MKLLRFKAVVNIHKCLCLMTVVLPIKFGKLCMMSKQTPHSGLIMTPHLPSRMLQPLSYIHVRVCTLNVVVKNEVVHSWLLIVYSDVRHLCCVLSNVAWGDGDMMPD